MTDSLPHDSRDADERREEHALRDLRARAKRARAVIAGTPGLAETLAADPRRAAMFYARWGITEEQILQGVPEAPGPTDACDEASFAPVRAVYT